jgi:predicted GNAT family N-acyltransferase
MNVAITSFGKSERDIRSVRDAVFAQEQKVARELDWDGRDQRCIHVLATNDSGEVIGTGRLQPDGKIGRMAVLKCWRGRGVGRKMLETLLESARIQGLAQVYLHAQVHAVPFYERSGFHTAGAEFMEAGIRHINMTRTIQPSSPGDAAARRTSEET